MPQIAKFQHQVSCIYSRLFNSRSKIAHDKLSDDGLGKQMGMEEREAEEEIERRGVREHDKKREKNILHSRNCYVSELKDNFIVQSLQSYESSKNKQASQVLHLVLALASSIGWQRQMFYVS